jgi:hypothetical protein
MKGTRDQQPNYRVDDREHNGMAGIGLEVVPSRSKRSDKITQFQLSHLH